MYAHGWHTTGGYYAEAAALLKRVAELSPDYVFAHFDYGCRGWLPPSDCCVAYARAVGQVDSLHPLRQRGLLHVAALDIVEGVRFGESSDGAMPFEMLKKRMERLACRRRTHDGSQSLGPQPPTDTARASEAHSTAL